MAADIVAGRPESERLARLYFALVGAGEFNRTLELMHPDVELALRTRDEVLHGRAAVERFVEATALSRAVYEATAAEFHPLDDQRVVVEGRMRWMDDERILRDDPVVWALEFRDGLLWRSVTARSVAEAQAALLPRSSDTEREGAPETPR
jgi:ketosteroid isomerase-like protein